MIILTKVFTSSEDEAKILVELLVYTCVDNMWLGLCVRQHHSIFMCSERHESLKPNASAVPEKLMICFDLLSF